MASLKRKLDSLKSTLPGPEDSPIPSPSEDAPSPTGSDSPFLGPSRAQVDPELDGKAMDDGDGPSDNRDMEDMDMSEEEADGAAAEGWCWQRWSELLPLGYKHCLVGIQNLKMCLSMVILFLTADDKKEKNSNLVDKTAKSAAASKLPTTPTKSAKSNSAQSAPLTPMGVNLEKVDLGKISSILSSLTSAMKNTGIVRRLERIMKS